MLVIPAIEIRDKRCMRSVGNGTNSEGDIYSDDPIEVAFLWRKENARTIHITDYSGLYDGQLICNDTVREAVAAIEIPVQLLSRFADVAECESWLANGIYRIVVHDLILHDPEGVRGLVQRYGPSRICAGAIARSGKLVPIWRDVANIEALELAHKAAALGINRVLYSDRAQEGTLDGPNVGELQRLATESGIHVTAAGGIGHVQHLWAIQKLEPFGVDSVVIGRALYENRFPCQQLWRDIEIQRIQKSRSEWKGGVSTSTMMPRRDDESRD